MTDKTELLEALESAMKSKEIPYFHAVVSENSRGRYVLSVRLKSVHAEVVAEMFRDLTNFSYIATSSYKRNACTEVQTFIRSSVYLTGAAAWFRTL